MNKYTIRDFNKQFKDDNACLENIFMARYGGKPCPSCKRQSNFYKLNNRKCYSCQFCGHNIFPLANTIFHKSETSLKLWFYAMFLMSQSRNGVSAMELQRHLGVTYKTAWRMAKQIRRLMLDDVNLLQGSVEADETYIGGKKKSEIRGRGAVGKTPVIGMVERQGKIKTEVTPYVTSSTVASVLGRNIKHGSILYTDTSRVYHRAKKQGYEHLSVNHQKNEYAKGLAHTNTIEGFWSQVKRSLDGTYHAVSPKYLQNYFDEFSFRYNQRLSLESVFSALLGRAVLLVSKE